MRRSLTKFGWNFECWAVQKRVNLVDLAKSFQTSIYSWQTLRGSFSAVSKPIFASKYSLESSWRDLQDLHAWFTYFSPLGSQDFSQKSSIFFREWIMNFRFFHLLCRILHFFWEFLMKICPDFATNSRKEWRLSLFQSNLR